MLVQRDCDEDAPKTAKKHRTINFQHVHYDRGPQECYKDSLAAFCEQEFVRHLFWILSAVHVFHWFTDPLNLKTLDTCANGLKHLLSAHFLGPNEETKLKYAGRYITLARELYEAALIGCTWKCGYKLELLPPPANINDIGMMDKVVDMTKEAISKVTKHTLKSMMCLN